MAFPTNPSSVALPLPLDMYTEVFKYLGPLTPEAAKDQAKSLFLSEPNSNIVLMAAAPKFLELQAECQLQQIKRSKGLLKKAYNIVCKSTPESVSLEFVQKVRNIAFTFLRRSYACCTPKQLKDLQAPHRRLIRFNQIPDPDLPPMEESRLESGEEHTDHPTLIPNHFDKTICLWRPPSEKEISNLEIDQTYKKVRTALIQNWDQSNLNAAQYQNSEDTEIDYPLLENWNPIPIKLFDYPHLNIETLFRALYMATHRGGDGFVLDFFLKRPEEWHMLFVENPDRARVLLHKACIAGHIDVVKAYLESDLIRALLTRRSGDAFYTTGDENAVDQDSIYEICLQAAIRYNHFEVARFLLTELSAIRRNFPTYLQNHPWVRNDAGYQPIDNFCVDWEAIQHQVEGYSDFSQEQKDKLYLLIAKQV